ncbi:MAG: metallophosphoesterase [Candidatus Omnitrophota bacterium]
MGMKEDAFKRFTDLLNDSGRFTQTLPVGQNKRYIILSDLHLGDGEGSDKFKQNKDTMIKALEYYLNRDFSLILLGDIEDFHQVDNNTIISQYKEIYQLFKQFPDKRIYRVFGNHDIEWSLIDPIFGTKISPAVEAIKLGNHIMLTHGHQAEEWYEKDLNIVRVGTTLDRVATNWVGRTDPFSYTQLPEGKDQLYSEWAATNKKIFICGHTHKAISACRSMFEWIDVKIQMLDSDIAKAKKEGKQEEVKKLESQRLKLSKKQEFVNTKWDRFKQATGAEPIHLDPENMFYFNTGGGVYDDGMTGVEVEENTIRLAYWGNQDHEREVIWGQYEMDNILGHDITAPLSHT